MSSRKRQGQVSGSIFALYRCLLDLGYVVKSCKKVENHYRILLVSDKKDTCGLRDKVIRLYPSGVFSRDG